MIGELSFGKFFSSKSKFSMLSGIEISDKLSSLSFYGFINKFKNLDLFGSGFSSLSSCCYSIIFYFNIWDADNYVCF